MSARGHHGLLLGASGDFDPYWSNVSSLLRFDGSFADEKGIVWANTGATIATSSPAPKFGSGCGAFPGSPSPTYIQSPVSAAFGFGGGDFTVEGWLYASATTGDLCLFDNRTASNPGIAIYSCVSSGPGIGKLCYANNSIVQANSATSVPLNAWVHWALTRASNTVRGFLGGNLEFTTSETRTLASSAAAFYGASHVAGQPMKGFLDNCRITKGIARYTANFTPPTMTFPNQ